MASQKSTNAMRLTFLGTGTSQGVPVIGCQCNVCRSTDSHDKRLRTSAMIETDGARLIIDAGPDFRCQMLREQVNRIDGILLTHEHQDHTAGIDDVRAFNSLQGTVDIWGAEQVLDTIKKHFDYAFAAARYPGAPMIELHKITAGKSFEVAGVKVEPILGGHFQIPVFGFRIGKLAYLTDFNYISEDEMAKLHGLDTLVINALRHKPHMSHFTLSEALALSEKLAPRRIFFTHISDQLGLHSDVSQQLPVGCALAYDSLEVEIE